MSIGVNFFKDIKIINMGSDYYGCFNNIKLIDNKDTSWSAGNIIRLSRLFEKYTNVYIPHLSEYNGDIKEKLINPNDVIVACDKILNQEQNDEVDSYRDRLNYIKEMSRSGYFMAYDEC